MLPGATSTLAVTSVGDVTSKTHSGGSASNSKASSASGAGGRAAGGGRPGPRRVSRPGPEEGAGVRPTGEPGLPAIRCSSIPLRRVAATPTSSEAGARVPRCERRCVCRPRCAQGAWSPTKSTHTPIPSAMRSHHHGDQMAPAVATPSRSKGTRDGGGGCVGEGKSRVAVTPLIVNTLEPVAAASWAGVME